MISPQGSRCALVLILALGLTASATAQYRESSPSAFNTGVRFEYFSQTIAWDDRGAELTSDLTSILASLVLEYQVGPGFSLAALVGYSSSDYKGLVFRQLPFSIALEGGGVGGVLLGGEVKAALLSGGSFELDISGQLIASVGASKKWNIPDLAVDGTAEGKPVWLRAVAGPVFTFGRSQSFRPYLYPNIRYLWGTFELKETVQDLSGTEKKDIKGRGLAGISAGADSLLSQKILLQIEAGIYPHSDGTDYSTVATIIFSF
jgi:hypothetical protein